MAPTCPSVTPEPISFYTQTLPGPESYSPPGQSTSQHATVTWPFDHISGEGRSPSRRRAPPASCHHTQACPSTCYCHTLASRIGPSNGRHHRPACHHPTAVRRDPPARRCGCGARASANLQHVSVPAGDTTGDMASMALLPGSDMLIERDSRRGHTDDHNLTLIQTSPRRVLGSVRKSAVIHFRFRRAPNRARSLALSPRLECSAAIWLTAASASGLGDSPASASQVARTIGHALGLLKAAQPGLPSDLLRVKQRPERSAGSAWTWSLQRLLTWKRTQRTGRSTDK
ncbi:hypothetical protein AAY473_019460 [Plecturocebus cupreus]